MIAAVHRVVVVGGPGSGKSTLAATMADRLGVSHVELDALWWEPGWTPVDERVFRARLADATAGDGWVLDGHYLDEGAVDIVWPAADTLVWLDVARARAVARCLRRTTSRVVHRTELWGTNRQGIATLSPRSIAGLVRRWSSYSARIADALATNELPDLTVVRLRTIAEVDAYAGSMR